jgi:molecular chaperone HscA
MGGIAEKVIPRNSTIPVGAGQVFTTFKDGQNALDLHVVQGERELVADCRSLARFRLSGIPPMPAGMARVEVRFQVDADGILSVSAQEQSTGVTQAISVKPSHGLSEEEIEQMLVDSIDHAEDDIALRQLREQQVEAERVLTDTQKQLAAYPALVDAAEKAQLEADMAHVRALAEGNDSHAIKAALLVLDERTKPFVERVMNQAMQQALAGHSVEEY